MQAELDSRDLRRAAAGPGAPGAPYESVALPLSYPGLWRVARATTWILPCAAATPPVGGGRSAALALFLDLLEGLAALLLARELVGELLDLGLHLAALVGQAHLEGL